MKKSFVTIGLPFKNNEKTLKLAIASILNQSYENWNLILINDKSTDHSTIIAEEFAALDNRITIINDGKNKGLPSRLNQIAKLCKTEYLFRMDADDIMFSQRIDKQLHFLKNNSNVDLIGSEVLIIDENNKLKGHRKSNPNEEISKQILKNNFFIHPSVAGKSIWFKENPYNPDFKRSQDFELWSRTFSKSNFDTVNEPLLFYRDHNNFSFEKYYENQNYRRKIIKNLLSNSEISISSSLLAYISSYLKLSIYMLSSRLGLYKRFASKNRNTELSDSQKYLDELNIILNYSRKLKIR